MLAQRDSSEDTARADNLRELVNAMAEGAERGERFPTSSTAPPWSATPTTLTKMP